MIPLTIWMNTPSFYQSDLFRAIGQTKMVDLQVIYAQDLSSERKKLGWKSDLRGYRYQFLDQRNSIRNAIGIARRQRKRIHIVNGLWAEPAFAAALVTFALLGSTYGLYSEAADPNISRSFSKRLIRRVFGSIVLPGAKGIFAVSHMGAQFFCDLAQVADRIYPFGYFRSSTQADYSRGNSINQGRIEFIFVGQIIQRKGLDLLLEAMIPLFDQYKSLSVSLIGIGEMAEALQQDIKTQGLESRITFEGIISPSEIPERIARADALILPSRWDGWGLVVNEALSVGVPAIVSDCCGAADLIKNGVNGYIFRNEDIADLRLCLAAFLARRTEWMNFRAAAITMGQKISAESVAPYFVECLEHMIGQRNIYPIAPWIDQKSAL